MNQQAWKKEYRSMKLLDKKRLELLENGAKCMTDSWLLQAMHNDYKKIMGLTPPERGNYQSSFKEFNKKHCTN